MGADCCDVLGVLNERDCDQIGYLGDDVQRQPIRFFDERQVKLCLRKIDALLSLEPLTFFPNRERLDLDPALFHAEHARADASVVDPDFVTGIELTQNAG